MAVACRDADIYDNEQNNSVVFGFILFLLSD
jgi:hypothetical protein